MDRKDATKPPFNRRKEDPWHTEVKEYVDIRHAENSGRFDHIEGRVLALEQQGEIMQIAIDDNTKLTKSVKSDTAALVEMWNGMGTIGKLILWASPIATTIIAALALWWKK